jgi:ribA/ribD-fused uncharacterized protein
MTACACYARYMSENLDPVYLWEDEFYPLSNFAAFAVEYQGVLWATGEHAYQAASFTDESICAEIATARSAHEARLLGQEHKAQRRSDWSNTKVQVMEDIFRAKLAQHVYVKEKLLASGSREIIKNVPDDSFWGWGADHAGENRMGKLWMQLRDELQKSQNPSA